VLVVLDQLAKRRIVAGLAPLDQLAFVELLRQPLP
jgi:hypothetical protein